MKINITDEIERKPSLDGMFNEGMNVVLEIWHEGKIVGVSDMAGTRFFDPAYSMTVEDPKDVADESEALALPIVTFWKENSPSKGVG